ncbi:glycerophosphodiester phosphodiesterase [Marinobacter sp. P4B1]|uniref:glycerophosphodiester phosphodiesterase n=1 Tax=Marinobacter sp. P4B1 TaxID=1119533 RepID=UPI00071D0385|nr:glycerophosphodiester phosphodiesterase [Marinobacter sp. P4B1]KRW82143.1 hypothetical protein AQ621_11055 [Marinobacter sp. P4B1]
MNEFKVFISFFFVIFLGLLSGCGGSHGSETSKPDLTVISHRGASGYLPESTLPAFVLAYTLGADFLEMDLVMSRDGVPVVFHDLVLNSTTDVADIFPGYQREDGKWYVSDLSVAELRQLNVFERFDGRFPAGSQGYSIPTFESVLLLVQELNARSGCNVGVYPEIKDPAYHFDIGLPMEAAVVNLLAKYGYVSEDSGAYIQSFDRDSLIEIRYALQSDIKLVQLIGSGKSYDEMATADGLAAVSDYAHAIGPSKTRVIESQGALVRNAHAWGLQVHPYTFQADRIPAGLKGFEDELDLFVSELGVDGVFTDHPDQVLEYLDREGSSSALASRCSG